MNPCALPEDSLGIASSASARPWDWVIDAPTPWNMRKMINWVTFCDKPQASDASDETSKPKPNNVWRP